MLQLHGDESPKRVSDIAGLSALPVIKAIGLRTAADLDNISDYAAAADWLLFDNKSPAAPGGTGQRFDWNLLQGLHFDRPWMLAGGLTCGNVSAACARLSPDAVDVSSGVESAPGVKDPAKIKAFIAAAKTAI